MLTYLLEHDKQKPLYLCLYAFIRKDIESGILKPNEKLPSKRNLAEHLHISVITVQNAYTQLIVEGYIYPIARKGYFVVPLQQTVPLTSEHRETKEILPRRQENKIRFDFKSNSTIPDQFPFTIWAKLMREVLSERNPELLESGPSNGNEKLRISIATYLHDFRGMTVSADRIVIGAGAEYLYSLVVQLLGRDKVYAVENPGYQKIAKIYRNNGAVCLPVRTDDHGISAETLQSSDAEVVHITPAHHFPLGIVMPISRRNELLAWANEEEDRIIIEDDYDSEFRFQGKPVQPMINIDQNQKVIYVNTFSKTLFPSLRISYMVLPDRFMQIYNQKLGFYSSTVPSFDQLVLANFIAGGYYEQHINRMRNYYKRLRNQLIFSLRQSSLQDRIQIIEEDSGLHFLLKVDTTMKDEEIVKKAEILGINLSCLSEYYFDRNSRENGTLLINYSGISIEQVDEAIETLSAIF